MAKSYLDKDGLLYFLQKIRPNATPQMDGTAATGTAKRFANQDHVHPTDTSRAPLASPAFTGTPTAPTAATGTTTTQIATTEFVANTVGAMTSGVSDVKVNGTSVVTNGIANVNLTAFTRAANGLVPLVGANLADDDLKKRLLFGTGWVQIGGGMVYNTNTLQLKLNNLTDDVTVASWTLPAATTSNAGLMPPADKTKLDSLTVTNGVIDASNLPSYVDDVIEAYARSGQTALSSTWLSTTSGGSALTPETGKIYVLMADSGDYAANTQFRWSGSAYVKLADGGVSSITNAEIDTIVAS